MNIFKQRAYNLLFHSLISSLIYRLIIIVYGAYIVFTHENIIAGPYYAALIPVYIFLYIKLLGEKWKYLRLILDAVVIMAVLYGKAPLDNISFVYALFPLISSITHTGFHSKYWPVLLLTYIMLFILDLQTPISYLAVPLFIWLVGVQSWYNNKTNDFLTTITAHIDNYFADSDGTKRPHEIYKNIIKEINSFLKESYLQNVYSYTLKDNVLWLVNSSEFMWQRTLDVSTTLLGDLKKHGYYYDKENHNKLFYVERRGVVYVYKCDINPSFDRIGVRKKYVVDYVLEVTFGKVSTILASEYRIAETRRKAFEETKGHIDYVTRALKVMHFIRNKMSPIKTVITFYSNQDNMRPEKVKIMEERIKQEVRQANKDMTDIINTANYLLDKQNNPYGGSDIEQKNIKLLFVILSEIVELHLGGTVSVSENITNKEQDKYVKVSVTQLKLLFTDIISNIEKYKHTDYSINMESDGSFLIVSFMNDIDPKQESECSILVRDINNNDNESILARKSHGVYNIKAAASVMGVDLEADMVKDTKKKNYVLTTKFKLYDGNNGNKNDQDSGN